MLFRGIRPPVDYRLCNQTVTLYHWDSANDTCTRKVIEKGAFLDFRKASNVDKTGSKEVNSFLLVIPCKDGKTIPVAAGDKVYHGVGPEIGEGEWSRFIPAKVPGLVVVKTVDPKYWRDQLVHTEAAG